MSLDRLRRQALEARRRRTPEEVLQISAEVVARFLKQISHDLAHWKDARVALYRALPGELSLRGLEEWLREAGCRLHYPRIVGKFKIEFAEVPARLDPESAWQRGPLGIEEPHFSLAPVDPSSLQVIFMPGLAFGPEGQRVGMGAGYYDRFLPQATQALRVALTFDDQLFGQIEQNPWDQPVHWILTDRRDVIPQGNAERIRKWFFKR